MQDEKMIENERTVGNMPRAPNAIWNRNESVNNQTHPRETHRGRENKSFYEVNGLSKTCCTNLRLSGVGEDPIGSSKSLRRDSWKGGSALRRNTKIAKTGTIAAVSFWCQAATECLAFPLLLCGSKPVGSSTPEVGNNDACLKTYSIRCSIFIQAPSSGPNMGT